MALEPVVIVDGTEEKPPAFHWPDEEWTGRRVVLGLGTTKVDCGQARIRIMEIPWADESERLEYLCAVEANPRHPGEGAGSYIRRIAELVEGKLSKPLPRMARGVR